jgi:hypothetical protein
VRENLAALAGTRVEVEARVQTVQDGTNGERMCLREVRANKRLLTGHVWVERSARLDFPPVRAGVVIRFTAIPTAYRRANGTSDYCLSKVRAVGFKDTNGEWRNVNDKKLMADNA